MKEADAIEVGDLLAALNSALRFAASRSAITSEQENAIRAHFSSLTPRADRTEREALDERRQAEELALLYNHADNDSAQFTRWQMMTAIAHGWRIAALRPTPPVEGEREEALGEALFKLSARLKSSGFFDDAENHAVYERVVSAFNAPVEVGAIDRAREIAAEIGRKSGHHVMSDKIIAGECDDGPEVQIAPAALSTPAASGDEPKGEDRIAVPRSVLAAAGYIIRHSKHADTHTAEAIRSLALSKEVI